MPARALPLLALLWLVACTSASPPLAPPSIETSAVGARHAVATSTTPESTPGLAIAPTPPASVTQGPSFAQIPAVAEAAHPLLDAEAPVLPPQDAPLAAVTVDNPGHLPGAPASLSLNLPPGFAISVYAVTGGGPRFMAVGPDGSVYVALMTRGQVVRLVDRGGYATPEVVLSGLDNPSSLAFFGGYLYVGEMSEIARFRVTDTGVDPESKEAVISNLPIGGHITRTVAFGPDGLLYLAVGSSCNVCIESNPLRAAITVFDADGHNGRTYATGLRNAVGITWQPGTGELWATVNGRDNIGQDMGLSGQAARDATDNLPPDYITRVANGGNYGWPRCYGDHQLDPRYGDAAFCARALPPTIEIQAHSAPLGLAFYDGGQFPAAYQGNLFVALHGSWNRQTPTGYKIVRVVFADGRPVRVEDFATGWLAQNGAVSGRPVGVLVAPDGAVLVSDDNRGVIYRISYEG
jgi:glucose/arabinose dehydrogenase